MTLTPIEPRRFDADDLRGLPQVGEIFAGKYRIDEILGLGGMGMVCAATHLRLEEKVAIKFLLPDWCEDAALVQRFMREGRASIKIRSEHVVRVLDVGMVDEQPYLVLEYLAGKDFEAIMAERGPLHVPDAVDCLLQACEALAEAHVAGIIHRDLKPANLFLTHRADGSPCVKVLDFGISKITGMSRRLSGFQATQGTLPNTVMGSPPYMSPEQMQSSRDVDARSDIWSIGAITHELVAGKPPFQADTITALCASILRDPPPPLRQIRPEVPEGLEKVVLRCLEKEPADRFPDVAALARALAAFGSANAQTSADRISRIIDGGISRSNPPEPERRARPSAVEALASLPPTPLRSAVPGYALAAAAMLLIGGGIAWKLVRQANALHDVATRVLPAQLAPTLDIPPPPPATSSAPAVSRLPTTSAVTPARAQAATPTPTPTATPTPTPTPVPHHPPHPHHAWHRSPPPAATTTEVDDPYADLSASSPPAPPVATQPPAPAPASSPSPSASTSPPADPNQLFEGRK